MRMLGDKLIKDSTRRTFADAMAAVRQALGRRSPREVESEVGRVLEDVLIRSEQLEEALVSAQANRALSESQVSTVRDGINGLVRDNRVRISQWENTIRHRDRVEREDFLWKTWDWLSQSLTWLQGKA